MKSTNLSEELTEGIAKTIPESILTSEFNEELLRNKYEAQKVEAPAETVRIKKAGMLKRLAVCCGIAGF